MDQGRQFQTNNVDLEDDDDFSDSLSPSDGYFSNSPRVPPTLLVVDEPAEEASRSKAREAAEDSPMQRYRDITPPDSPQMRRNNIIYTPSTSSHDSSDDANAEEHANQRESFLQDPPPQYEAATAGRRPQQSAESVPLSPGATLTYNTMSNVRSPAPFHDNPDQPMSMADDHGDMYDTEGASPYPCKVGWFDRASRGGRCRRFLVKMMIVLFGTWLIIFVVKAQQKTSHTPSEHSTHPTFPAQPPTLKPVDPSPVDPSPIDPPALEPSDPSTPSLPSDPPTKSHLPRGTRIIRTSSSVSGQFTLEDYLYIRTTSGSVTISIIIPQSWSSTSAPCKIDIGTSSGSIHIAFLDHRGLPLSDSAISSFSSYRPLSSIYRSAASGSISGSFLHGNTTTLESHSGSISGTVFPVVSHSEYPAAAGSSSSSSSSSSNLNHLTSISTSGSQTLTLQFPFSTPRSYFTSFRALHKSLSSASVTLKYPSSWGGRLEMLSHGSGSLTALGRNLVVEEDTGRHLIARRGSPDDDDDHWYHGDDDWHDHNDDWFVAASRPVNVLVEGDGSGSLTFRC